jgi:protein involved in sex pheromone biosynthesis
MENQIMKIWKKAVGILAVAGVSLSLAACGTSGDKKDNATKDKNPSSVDAIKNVVKLKSQYLATYHLMGIWMLTVRIRAMMSISAIKLQKI